MNKLLEYISKKDYVLKISQKGLSDDLEFIVSHPGNHHVAARLTSEHIKNNEAIDEFCDELIYTAERYFKSKS